MTLDEQVAQVVIMTGILANAAIPLVKGLVDALKRALDPPNHLLFGAALGLSQIINFLFASAIGMAFSMQLVAMVVIAGLYTTIGAVAITELHTSSRQHSAKRLKKRDTQPLEPQA